MSVRQGRFLKKEVNS